MHLSARAFTIPTDAPEGDGTIAWSSTGMVLVEASADGISSTGWTYGPAAASIVVDLLAPVVQAVDPDDVPGAWLAMQQRLRNAGRPGVAGLALSAADNAIWDLKARRRNLPLARLLGTVRHQIPGVGRHVAHGAPPVPAHPADAGRHPPW
jgi:L-alanine-DL-glutamate epimerase-like enolase superfamily enzyme